MNHFLSIEVYTIFLKSDIDIYREQDKILIIIFTTRHIIYQLVFINFKSEEVLNLIKLNNNFKPFSMLLQKRT